MKKIITCILIIFIVIGLCACNQDVLYKSDYYNIYCNDGRFSIKFNKALQNEEQSFNGISSSDVIYYPHFDSVEDMINAIKTGSIQPTDLQGLRTLAGEGNTLELFDIETPMNAIVPSDTVIEAVLWLGSSYQFSVTSNSCQNAAVYCHNESRWQEVFQEKYTNILDNQENITYKTLVDRQSTEILFSNYTGNYKMIRYTLADEEYTLYVQETYCLDHIYPEYVPPSDTIPYQVQIFCADNGLYVYMSDFTERPSVEWLSSFGLTPLEG